MKQLQVLERAWKSGIAVQSQFFRENPIAVALCASLGHISTIDHEGDYGNVWRITTAGLQQLHSETEDTQYETTGTTGYTLDSQAPHRTTYLGFIFDNSFYLEPVYFNHEADF